MFVKTTEATLRLAIALICCSPLVAAQNNKIPDKASQLNQQGVSHLEKKEYTAAIKLFRQAVAISPDYRDALDNLGTALAVEGKDDEAISDFQKVIRLAPDDAIAQNGMGHALFHEEKYAEAAAAYRRAIAIHEDRLQHKQRGGRQAAGNSGQFLSTALPRALRSAYSGHRPGRAGGSRDLQPQCLPGPEGNLGYLSKQSGPHGFSGMFPVS
jgi:tetratricopeptide (TPR) repeat protein